MSLKQIQWFAENTNKEKLKKIWNDIDITKTNVRNASVLYKDDPNNTNSPTTSDPCQNHIIQIFKIVEDNLKSCETILRNEDISSCDWSNVQTQKGCEELISAGYNEAFENIKQASSNALRLCDVLMNIANSSNFQELLENGEVMILVIVFIRFVLPSEATVKLLKEAIRQRRGFVSIGDGEFLKSVYDNLTELNKKLEFGFNELTENAPANSSFETKFTEELVELRESYEKAHYGIKSLLLWLKEGDEIKISEENLLAIQQNCLHLAEKSRDFFFQRCGPTINYWQALEEVGSYDPANYIEDNKPSNNEN